MSQRKLFSLFSIVFAVGFSDKLCAQIQKQRNYTLVCSAEEDCHVSIGALISNQSDCTAFLVGTDVIGTNLHCIPESIRKKEASCDGVLEFVLPALKGRKQEVLGCKKVLHISPPLEDVSARPDYAFLQLKESTVRPFFSVSQAGLKDQQLTVSYKVNPDPSHGRGIGQRLACRAIQNSIRNPLFENDFSSVVFLSDCPVIPGNSGSPILIGDKVVGVLSLAHLNEASSDGKDMGQVAREKPSGFSSGSNLACVDLNFLGYYGQAPSACAGQFGQKVVQSKVQNLIAESMNNLNINFSKSLELEQKTFNQRNKVEFEFVVKRREVRDSEKANKVSDVFVLRPACYHLSRINQKSSDIVRFIMGLKRWSVRQGVEDKTQKLITELKEELVNFELSYAWSDDYLPKGMLLNIHEQSVGERPEELRIGACPFEPGKAEGADAPKK